MTTQHVIVATAIVLLVCLAVVAWFMWEPVKRVSLVELQVQEFRQQVREWENGQHHSTPE